MTGLSGGRTAWIFPGQGSQQKGMGRDLFAAFPDLVERADHILGYSVRTLCLEGPPQQLNQTQYTQPVLYTVNALATCRRRQDAPPPDFVAGHSLGEYNALLAADVFDFETGLRLVQERGRLMSEARAGAMAAVFNLNLTELRSILDERGFDNIDIANYNTPSQIVISGLDADIRQAIEALSGIGTVRCVPLRVSGAFHSRYMSPAQQAFALFLEGFTFGPPRIPVIANVTARPHAVSALADTLARQMTHQVNWVDSIRYLMGQGVSRFEEIGPGQVLSGLVAKIRAEATPLVEMVPRAPKAPEPDQASTPSRTAVTLKPTEPALRHSSSGPVRAESLGSRAFRDEHATRYAYAIGGMAHGVASTDLVIKASRAGLLSFFGADGLPVPTIKQAVGTLRDALGDTGLYGAALCQHCEEPIREHELVDIYLDQGVHRLEAVGFVQVTPALVRYRLKGLLPGDHGPVATNLIMARTARQDVAEAFLAPAPEAMLGVLVQSGEITAQQAELARHLPMADDICVDVDGGGGGGPPGSLAILLPALRRLRDRHCRSGGLDKAVRIGAGAGIGTPEAAAAAFFLGADFILTDSINQGTVEAATSMAAKDILQSLTIDETAYAPSERLFELGGVTEVAHADGLLFSVRARKLYDLYRHHDSISEIDPVTLKVIEESYFGARLEEVFDDIAAHYAVRRPQALETAARSPKYKMGLIFKWYLQRAGAWARQGSAEQRVNYSIPASGANGAFNQWVSGTTLESWRHRHVDDIAMRLMEGAADVVCDRLNHFKGAQDMDR